TIAFNVQNGLPYEFAVDGYIPMACCNDQIVLGHNGDQSELSVSLDGKFTLNKFPFQNPGSFSFGRQLRYMWIGTGFCCGPGGSVSTYAGDLVSGAIRWRSMNVKPYLAEGDYVLAGGVRSSAPTRLINASSGATVWELPTELYTGACLGMKENTIIAHARFPDEPRSISCFDLTSSERIWHVTLNSEFAWGLVATIGIVWHADEVEVGKWRLFARDIHSGEVLWQSSPSRSRLVVRAIVDDCLLVSRGRTL